MKSRAETKAESPGRRRRLTQTQDMSQGGSKGHWVSLRALMGVSLRQGYAVIGAEVRGGFVGVASQARPAAFGALSLFGNQVAAPCSQALMDGWATHMEAAEAYMA